MVWSRWVAPLAVSLILAGAGIRAGGSTPTTTPPPARAPEQTQPAGYAGSDSCVLCHTPEADALKGTQHAQAKNPRSPAAGFGCETCHGPGQAHVDDEAKGHIKKFAALRPSEINETCLTCHNRGGHAAWDGSVHEARNLSCTTCHSVHHPVAAERQLVKPTETALCATCHRQQVIKTERAVAHMPVREGKLSCSSCHNPHGGRATSSTGCGTVGRWRGNGSS